MKRFRFPFFSKHQPIVATTKQIIDAKSGKTLDKISGFSGESSGESSGDGEPNTNKAFLRVSEDDGQHNTTLLFIEGSKEEILEKLSAFDAFDVEYIHFSSHEGHVEVDISSCLCHVKNEQIEDFGTIKTISVFVPFPHVDNQEPVGKLIRIDITLFKPNDSDTYAFYDGENFATVEENVPLVMEDKTYTGILIRLIKQK